VPLVVSESYCLPKTFGGADNHFGHAAQATLTQLANPGVRVLCTDQAVTVEVTTDAERYWVRAGRAQSR